MIHEPDVLILDEPTSGLDPNQIVEIRNLIKQLGRAKTVILSTHILSEVQATCDRVIIVNEGSIVADGTPSELQEKFHGAESVSVEFKVSVSDPVAEVFPKIKSLAGVESVEYDGGSDDVHRFTVYVGKGSDVREGLFRAAVAEKWILLGMSRKGTSLEEVFHMLTQAENEKT
jgi:ABC-2 type transport system ATP-binding protein